jgi:hypothetical protein
MQPAGPIVRVCAPSGEMSAWGLPAVPLATSAHLTYFGGRVISNIKIVMVLYGPPTTNIYSAFLTNDAPRSMVSFYQQVVNSSYIDWLCEYDTPTQNIGRGTFGGKYTIFPSAANNGSSIDDTNIQAELAAQIAGGHLPLPDPNTLYMLHFPQSKSITMSGQRSCVYFCAYHGTTLSSSGEIYYAVIPDLANSGCNGGCGGAPLVYDNECSVASHEMIESITDPEVGLATVFGPPLGWYDPSNGEIGDICNGQQATFVGTDGFTYTVQKGFSNHAGGCISSSLLPLASAQTVTNRQDTQVAIDLTGVDPNVCPRPLTFSVTANPKHGTLTGTAPILTYSPASGYSGQDNFQFKVNNGLRDSTPATVSIFDVPTHVTVTRLPDHNIRLTFAAIQGWPYQVQASDYLNPPITWVTILTTNSGTNSTLVFDDLTATNHPKRFYRPATP